MYNDNKRGVQCLVQFKLVPKTGGILPLQNKQVLSVQQGMANNLKLRKGLKKTHKFQFYFSKFQA